MLEVDSLIARMENLQYRMEFSKSGTETAEYGDLTEQIQLLAQRRDTLGKLLRRWGSNTPRFSGMALTVVTSRQVHGHLEAIIARVGIGGYRGGLHGDA
jgi:hypothetical protein